MDTVPSQSFEPSLPAAIDQIRKALLGQRRKLLATVLPRLRGYGSALLSLQKVSPRYVGEPSLPDLIYERLTRSSFAESLFRLAMLTPLASGNPIERLAPNADQLGYRSLLVSSEAWVLARASRTLEVSGGGQLDSPGTASILKPLDLVPVVWNGFPYAEGEMCHPALPAVSEEAEGGDHLGECDVESRPDESDILPTLWFRVLSLCDDGWRSLDAQVCVACGEILLRSEVGFFAGDEHPFLRR